MQKPAGRSFNLIMPEKTVPTAPSAAKRLEGKIAIVTGGSKGIGEATVRLFAIHGAKVVIADVDEAAGCALATELSPSVTYIRCNVSSEEEVINLINSTVTLYGKLDIMFNNAGILGKQSSILEFNAEEFDTLMNVNVRGVGLGMKHAARVMVPRGSGCIISTASVAAVIGGLGPHSYTASKHAILGLTKNVACELGKYGIRVNCISPFGVATTLMKTAWKSINAQTDDEDDSSSVGQIEEWVSSVANLKKATLKTEDVAEAALYLVSDESKYVSGHNLVLDGGITTSPNALAFS